MSMVTVVGNVGEPSMKFTPAGKAVLEFPLAENHSKKNQQGGWDEDGTTWRRVTIWEGKAEALVDVLVKGDRVIVLGNERIREWEAKDGSKGKSLEMVAQWVGIVPKAKQSGNPPQSGGFGSQQSAPLASNGSWTPDQGQSNGGWGNPVTDPWGTGG